MERKPLTKKLDKLLLQILRLRENNTCVKCGKRIKGCDSQTSHIVPKGNGASQRRWDLLNVVLMCYRCHLGWWHKNPLDAAEWFANKYPARNNYLRIYRGGKPMPIKTPQMESLVEIFRQKIKEFEND